MAVVVPAITRFSRPGLDRIEILTPCRRVASYVNSSRAGAVSRASLIPSE